MIFANRKASSLAAVILTMSKMLMNSFSANINNNNKSVISSFSLEIYDEDLFAADDFNDVLSDVWQLFNTSVTQYNSFRVIRFLFLLQFFFSRVTDMAVETDN